MFKPPEDRQWGEEPRLPRNEFTPSHKGYPARRDPQAENPKGIMSSDIGAAQERRLRQHYGPARKM
ncbi:MAG: hypothetical protein GW903_03855 [Alphaproteobacteria bacterium]|nr:hypothetical protein [Alphaproteobacteria bacterium]NCQ88106.1 hypothetical protein [Alphaproteobacteria bacterium]NCT05387.1 hypothetical protein [Alphaproteobacteria bacterium]